MTHKDRKQPDHQSKIYVRGIFIDEYPGTNSYLDAEVIIVSQFVLNRDCIANQILDFDPQCDAGPDRYCGR